MGRNEAPIALRCNARVVDTITRTLVEKINNECFEWQSPRELSDRVDALSRMLGDRAMHQPGRTFREAFIATRFARHRGAGLVRLLHENGRETTPDFQITVDSQSFCFETTEADFPDRRRQGEARRPSGIEPMEFISRSAMVECIRERATKKATKRYSNCRGLVIYINPPSFTVEPALRWRDLVESGEPAAKAFPEVWAIRSRCALLWLEGVAQPSDEGIEF